MTRIFFLPLFLCVSFFSKAQTKAVTDNGDEVILYKNGTWKYVNEIKANDSLLTRTSSAKFTKPETSTFLLKAKNGNVGIWIDPKKWSFGKSDTNPDADFELQHKEKGMMAIVISEPAEIPLESFEEIALFNGRTVAPDLEVLNKEFRFVNGLKVLHLQLQGTQMGMKFQFHSYNFSSNNSSVQFLVFSYTNVMKENKKEVEDLLNGLVQTQAPASELKATAPLLPGDIIAKQTGCKEYFNGVWNYKALGGLVHVERTLDKTVEYLQDRQDSIVYENKWIDECRYELVVKSTTIPELPLKIGGSYIVDIIEIDKHLMAYVVTHEGKQVSGRMTKSVGENSN